MSDMTTDRKKELHKRRLARKKQRDTSRKQATLRAEALAKYGKRKRVKQLAEEAEAAHAKAVEIRAQRIEVRRDLAEARNALNMELDKLIAKEGV